jgi:hypothetical protein
MKYKGEKELTQDIFKDQPNEVDWCGVDYDGLLKFGKAERPRYTWSSERWRGYESVGYEVENSGYKALTSLNRVS